MPDYFLDTNVLLYSISRDPGETRKRERAIALIDGGDLALSVQVRHESCWNVTASAIGRGPSSRRRR